MRMGVGVVISLCCCCIIEKAICNSRPKNKYTFALSHSFASVYFACKYCWGVKLPHQASTIECLLSRVLCIFRQCGRVDCANNTWVKPKMMKKKKEKKKVEEEARQKGIKLSSHMRISACDRVA